MNAERRPADGSGACLSACITFAKGWCGMSNPHADQRDGIARMVQEWRDTARVLRSTANLLSASDVEAGKMIEAAGTLEMCAEEAEAEVSRLAASLAEQVPLQSEANWAAAGQTPVDSDAAVIAAIRHELWQASDGRGFGGDRTLVGMVKTIIAQRDEARDNRRGEFDLRMHAEASLAAPQRLAEQEQQLQWVAHIVDGQPVSEFAESFPLVRAVADLRASLAAQAQRTIDAEKSVDQWAELEAEARARYEEEFKRAADAELKLTAQAQEIGQLRLERAAAREQLDKHIEWASDQLAALTKERDALKADKGWQPIDTAPQDGTPIVVALIEDGRVWRVSDARFNRIGFYNLGGQSCHWATHWMPLPAPPVLSSADPEAK